MEKKKKNIAERIFTNIYVKNLLLMATIFLVLVFIVLFWLKSYTKHNEYTTVPVLKGMQIEKAAELLKATNMSYEVVDSVYRDGGTPGAILEQIPVENSKVKKGRTIYLILQSKTVQMVEIPSLTDFSQRQAEAQLNALGFNKISINEIQSIYKGLVISVMYKGKEISPNQKVPKGASLTLIVGAGGEQNPDDNAGGDATETEGNTFFN